MHRPALMVIFRKKLSKNTVSLPDSTLNDTGIGNFLVPDPVIYVNINNFFNIIGTIMIFEGDYF